MKKLFFLVAIIVATVLNVKAEIPADLQAALPSGETVLPVPPAVGSPIWLDDSLKYFQYKEPGFIKEMVGGEEQLVENWDSVWAMMNEQYYFALHRIGADSVMDAPFLSNLSWTKSEKTGKYTVSYERNNNFPKMNELQALCEEMKTYHTGLWRTRPRPYKYFLNQWYHGSKQKQNVNDATSYPSGHGYFAGLFGNCLLYIDPENSEAIQAMMDEWLHCRLQLGAHWNTDLAAGKLLGNIAFDIAMGFDSFRELVMDAKDELRAYRTSQSIPINEQPITGDFEDDIETTLEELKTSLNGTATDFTIKRILYKDGFFNTICLPFSLDADGIAASPLAGCELYEFESATKNSNGELQLTIKLANEIKAGNPYLIKWESGENILSMTFNDVTITASHGNAVGEGDVKFVGIIGQESITGQNQLFVGANDQLYWPKAGSKPLKGFRAYFQVPQESNSAPAKFVIRPNMPTSIGQLESNEPASKMFENGQLVIIKNGVRYNAQGQIVK